MDEQEVPIMSLWDHLLVPLQGDMSDQAAARFVERLLRRVQDQGTSGVIIDLSGVWMMDSHLCSLLAKTVAALRLMGADTVVSGLSPEIVTTLMEMGVELKQFSTALSLEAALEHFGIALDTSLRKHPVNQLDEGSSELDPGGS